VRRVLVGQLAQPGLDPFSAAHSVVRSLLPMLRPDQADYPDRCRDALAVIDAELENRMLRE
jgi:hypothetical protein